MAEAAPPTADESGLVVSLAFSAMAFAGSSLALWRMSSGGAPAEAAAAAAAGTTAAAAAPPAKKKASPFFNVCAGVAGVSGAATAGLCWFVANAASLRPYDPYAELGLRYGASEKDVVQAYRKLSKTAHPDRGGSKAAFHALERAHRALTDPAAMANLRDYGNPEGASGPRGVTVDAAKNPLVIFLALAVLAAFLWAVARMYFKAQAEAAEEAAAAPADGAGAAGVPTSAKEIKIARMKAQQEQEARKREREAAKKSGSASPAAAAPAAAPAIEKMD